MSDPFEIIGYDISVKVSFTHRLSVISVSINFGRVLDRLSQFDFNSTDVQFGDVEEKWIFGIMSKQRFSNLSQAGSFVAVV